MPENGHTRPAYNAGRADGDRPPHRRDDDANATPALSPKRAGRREAADARANRPRAERGQRRPKPPMAEFQRNVEKLTELGDFREKNGICLHMSFIFCNFVADFLRAYRERVCIYV